MEKLLDKIKVNKIFILELLFILFIYAFLFSFFENVKGELGREQRYKIRARQDSNLQPLDS
jgi:hypothetical protein